MAMKSAKKFLGLAIACVVLLALSGVLYWSGHHKASNAASIANAAPVILTVKPSSVTALTIKAQSAPAITLAKGAKGLWQISAPKKLLADQEEVSTLLSDLSPLNGERIVESNPPSLKAFGLDHPTLEVDITQADHTTQRLLIGDNTPTGDSAYAMLAGDPRIFTTFRYNETNLDQGLSNLRDKRLITLTPDEVTSLELIRDGEDIQLSHLNYSWKMVKPGPYRANMVAADGINDAVTMARMSATQPPLIQRQTAFAQGVPVATVKLSGPKGSQSLTVREDNGNYYAQSNYIAGIYQVSDALGEALNKTLFDLCNKQVFNFSYDDPNEVDFTISSGKKHGTAKSWILNRTGEVWWLDGKKMDANSVESLVSGLRDLAASKFATSGFTKPVVQVRVVFAAGKRVENVQIAKGQGREYLAQRTDDPSLYVVDGGAVESIEKAAQQIQPASPRK